LIVCLSDICIINVSTYKPILSMIFYKPTRTASMV